MIGWGLVQLQAQKATDAQRIRRPPRDGALGVETFEVPEQQHAEIAPRRQARPANVIGVKPLAQRLDVRVEVGLVQNLFQARVERMRGAPRQVLGGHPH